MGRERSVSQVGSRGVPDGRGGVERVLEAVSPRLADRGIDTTVWCSWNRSRPGSWRGVRLAYAPSVPSKHFDTFVRSALAVACECVRGSSVIHIHASGSAPLALIARLFGKKVVVTVHGADWKRRKWGRAGRWFLRFGEWAAVRFPHRTVAVSEGLARALEDAYGRPVDYIPNGVEDRRARPADRIGEFGLRGDDYLLYLARLVPEKQPHVLIEAFKALSDRHGMRLVIAGPAWHSADYSEHLRRLAGDDPDIVFTGEVDEELLEELYSNCAAFVLPSEVEGMSLSLLDAMAFGACTVSSDIPANVAVVADAGRSFRVGDAAHLASVLEELLDDPEQMKALRIAARTRITTDFTWDAVADRWVALYEELLGEHRLDASRQDRIAA